MQKTAYDISVFLIATSLLVFTLIIFIISIITLYKKKQVHFENKLLQIRTENEKMILGAQLEMQEETFQHISTEIHDNIGLSLTLAKLYLNTINGVSNDLIQQKISNSIDLISRAINELSNISKSLNADIIINQGLLKAIEIEISKIRQTGIFELNFKLDGNPIFLEAQKELIIFRIVQEAFNNIIKHASATIVELSLTYCDQMLQVKISDNGKGFNTESLLRRSNEAGISNMKKRVQSLDGDFEIKSLINQGTLLSFSIPI